MNKSHEEAVTDFPTIVGQQVLKIKVKCAQNNGDANNGFSLV